MIKDSFLSSREEHLDEKLWLLAHGSSQTFSVAESKSEETPLVQSIDALKRLHALVTRVISMPQLQDQLGNFMAAIQDPLLSMATLEWLQVKLSDTNFYDWTSLTMGETPPAFHILDEIGIIYPLQRPYVFNVWKGLLERQFEMAPVLVMQFKQSFLDHMIILLKCNFVCPILEYLAQENYDAALYVHFLQQVIPKIMMPCDVKHYRCLVKMVKKIPSASLKEHTVMQALLSRYF